MENTFKFEQRETTCSLCGAKIQERYMPYINQWIRDKCECIKQKEREEQQEREKTIRYLKIRDNKRISGIAPRYKNASFENFSTTKATAKALKNTKVYCERFKDIEKSGKGLIFTGNTGSGKTHLACAAANKLLDDGVQVRFITYSDLMQTISGAHDFGTTQNKLITELQRCRLLIIDDIGAQAVTEKGRSVLFAILDKRVNNYKPTIFTSNIASLEELKTKFSEQIYDRIKGSCYKIDIISESHRKI